MDSKHTHIYVYIHMRERCTFAVIQSLSYVWLCSPMDCSTWGFPLLHHLPVLAQLMCIELMIPSDYLILYCPLLMLPSIFPSNRIFSNESAHIRWPKYWSFSISACNKYSVSILFRIDWFDLLAVKGFSRVFSNTTVLKNQSYGIQPSLWSNSHIHTWLQEKP